ncbi:MAG TPA: MFS transporter [Gaiella sp.]|jgi:MFS family permease|nr:MFS transporter [Gaiella sp.]
MRVARALARLIWGEDVDRPLRPVLGVTLASSAAGSGLWSFMAIWAVEELGAKSELPFVYLVGAVFAGASGFLGGYLSDRVGRRRVILFGQGALAVYPLVLLALSDSKWAALVALTLAGVFGSLGGSVAQAMVADLVAPERHEAAYSSVRVASNLGVVLGPPLGGLMLVVGSWTALFPTVAVLSAVAWVIAWRFLPHRGAYSPEGPPERGSLGTILRDRPFLLFLGSAVFAWLVYVAYEVVLPVSLVDGFGYEPSAWGFLVWINPLLVTLLQIHITRRTADVSPAPKLVAALLIMGLPFLLLVYSHSILTVVIVVVVFVIGEMLWVPTSQAVVAAMAPQDIRGAYMGAFGSAPAIGFALAPLIGFQVRNSFGDDATWTMFAALGVVAAILGGIAIVGVGRRRESLVSSPS